MKKILAIICAISMLLSLCPSAFAKEARCKFDMQAQFKMEMEKGLDYLSEMTKELGVDAHYMFKELFKATYTMNVKADTSVDFLSGTLYVETYSNTPIAFSDDLKISIDSKLRVWADYDFSSEEAFKCKVIFVNPLTGKYTFVDLNNEELNSDEEFKEFKKTLIEGVKNIEYKKGSEEIATLVKKVIEGKAKIEKTADLTTITFNNDAFVEAAFELFEDLLATDYVKNLFALIEEEMPQIDTAELDEIENMVKGLNIFPDDAYTLKVKADAFGKVSEMEETVHVKCNLYEIAEAMGTDMEYEAEYITKENTDIDVKLTSSVQFNHSPFVIEMPLLTEENSVDYLDEFFDEYILPEDTYTYIPERFSSSVTGAVVGSDTFVYAQYFIDNGMYNSDNLTGSIEIDEAQNVTMILSTDYMAPVKIEGAVGADTYKINGVEEKGVAFVIADVSDAYSTERNDAICVNVKVLNKVLECTIRSTTTTYTDYMGTAYEKPVFTVYMVRPNKGYSAE